MLKSESGNMKQLEAVHARKRVSRIWKSGSGDFCSAANVSLRTYETIERSNAAGRRDVTLPDLSVLRAGVSY